MTPIWLLLACAAPLEGWPVELSGRVMDSEGLAVEGASVSLASGSDGAWIGDGTTDAAGEWSVLVLLHEEGSSSVAAWVEAADHAPVVAWSSLGTWDQGEPSELGFGPTETLETGFAVFPSLVLPGAGEGAASGVVLDGRTGAPAGQLAIELREGWNAPDERPIVDRISGDLEGHFSWLAESGLYTATIRGGSGYGEARFPVRVEPEGRDDHRAVVLPPLEEGTLAAAMSWRVGELDLHLSGPRADSVAELRFQVWEGAPLHPPTNEVVAELTRLGGAVEVVEVHTVREEGYYQLSAHAPEGSPALSLAQPVIQLWWGGKAEFAEAPPSAEAGAWTALRLDEDRDELQRPERWFEVEDASDPATF